MCVNTKRFMAVGNDVVVSKRVAVDTFGALLSLRFRMKQIPPRWLCGLRNVFAVQNNSSSNKLLLKYFYSTVDFQAFGINFVPNASD